MATTDLDETVATLKRFKVEELTAVPERDLESLVFEFALTGAVVKVTPTGNKVYTVTATTEEKK